MHLPDTLTTPPSSSKNSSDKPLPSPPAFRIEDKSPAEENPCLIDAAEKPLRRSPPGASREEEWPTLIPEKISSTGNATKSSTRSVSREKERYPLLGNTLPTEAVSHPPTAAEALKTCNQTAGAAAIEKSLQEARPINQPRQTRTSSLRARISAGQLMESSPSKVIGFTDFTKPEEPLLNTNRNSLRVSGSIHTRSLSPSATRLLSDKASMESLRGNRAPAQFVAGRRRPAPMNRPSSRNNLRDEARCLPPTLLAPGAPAKLGEEPKSTALPITALPTGATRASCIGTSSIPVFRRTVASVIGQTDAKLDHSASTPVEPDQKESSKDMFNIFEDSPHKSGIQTQSDQQTLGSEPHNHDDISKAKRRSILGSIQESPQQFKLKRLSMNSPDFGPTLKISRSAEKVIMGDGSDKENQPLIKKDRKKDLSSSTVSKGKKLHQKTKDGAKVPKTRAERPHSSQGLISPVSRIDTLRSDIRARKGKSVDLTCPLPANVIRKKPVSSTQGSARGTDISTNEDPFFDARSFQPGMTTKMATNGIDRNSAKCNEQHKKHADATESWKSPMEKNDEKNFINERLPASSDFYSANFREYHATQFDEAAIPGYKDSAAGVELRTSPPIKSPFTPDQGAQDAGIKSSGSFPPRSSSHTPHPDYTVDGSGGKTPPSPLEKASKGLTTSPLTQIRAHNGELSSRQSNLGTADRSHRSSKRESTAMESTKTHGSISKGVLSNFRGFFHKRSSGGDEAKSAKKAAKSKSTVSSTGSPFPPLSNLHKPTRASAARAGNQQNKTPAPKGLATPGTTPAPTNLTTTTSLAMQILESARLERSSPRKEELLQLGRVVVEAITKARDAERAMEEAKLAAGRAEQAYEACMNALGEVRIAAGGNGRA